MSDSLLSKEMTSRVRDGAVEAPRRDPATPTPPSLPEDVMYEILLNLPAKALCRLRAGCRPWRSLLSNPPFIAAHAGRHPGPLLIATHASNAEHNVILNIMDLSGQVTKQVRIEDGKATTTSMASDLVCIKSVRRGSYRLVNPATGAVHPLAYGLAQEHLAQGLNQSDYSVRAHLFGQVVGRKKGAYKVLRILPHRNHGKFTPLFEVCTLKGNRCARWRGTNAPSQFVPWYGLSTAVIDGVVYLLNGDVCIDFEIWDVQATTKQHWIAPFDLETEWRPSIRGPSSLIVHEDAAAALSNSYQGSNEIALTNCNGSLAIVRRLGPSVQMWFLMNSQEGLWVKQCSLQVDRPEHLRHVVHPLLVLDDGRVVIFIFGRYRGLLQIYDPRSNTFTDVAKLSHCLGVSLYTGNLLSLNGQN